MNISEEIEKVEAQLDLSREGILTLFEFDNEALASSVFNQNITIEEGGELWSILKNETGDFKIPTMEFQCIHCDDEGDWISGTFAVSIERACAFLVEKTSIKLDPEIIKLISDLKKESLMLVLNFRIK